MAAKGTNNSANPADAEIAAQLGASGGVPEVQAVGVDKIRDLLFGNQMQDYDRRFSMLEERFMQRFKDIEAETGRNLNSFESNAKKQVDSLAGQLREEKEARAEADKLFEANAQKHVDSLAGQLRDEKNARTEADKEVERKLREQIQALEKQVRTLSDQLSQFERDITDRLTKEAAAVREEIKRRNDETQNAVEKMFAELNNVKTDRNLLAGLFIEVAKCLNQDVGGKANGKADPAHKLSAN